MTVSTGSQRARRPLSQTARSKFLEALAAGWSVAHAAERAGFARQRFYEMREDDEAFASAWEEARERGIEVLEDELRRRALEGWDEETFGSDGQLLRRVRRYNPAYLIFALKAARPEVYRDNNVSRVEVTGANGGPVEMTAGYEPPTLADLVRLAGDLGVLDQLGYVRAETVDGDAAEVLELGEGAS